MTERLRLGLWFALSFVLIANTWIWALCILDLCLTGSVFSAGYVTAAELSLLAFPVAVVWAVLGMIGDV